jgi:N,N'-diacetylchitobiose transport system permease protein
MWKWMTDYQSGVLNYILDKIGFHSFAHYNWLVPTRPMSGLVLIGIVVVWGALPFVVITLYAALTQVPKELVEAATVDGAGPLTVFRMVTLPILRPVLVIVTSLSIIWDFGVFTQPYLLIGQSKITPGNYLMSVYLFEEGYFRSDFGRGAAISMLMLLIVAVLSVFYVRKMVRIGDAA